MANESDLDAGKMVKDVADQTGQVSRAPVASDGTITIPHNSAGLKSVDLADVDLLLTFSDSTFVIIPNGALEAISDAQHSVLFSDQKSSLADLFKMVGISNHAKSGSLRVVSGDLNAVKPVEVAAEPKQPEKELASSADLCLPEPLVAPAPMVKAPKVTSGSLAAIDQSDPLDPVAQHTMSHTPSYRSGTTSPELTPSIKFDPGITADNVINIAESQGSVLIAGRVAGSAKAGDTVTVTVNGVDSTTLVNSDKSFSVSVSGRDLVADTDHTIEARITTPAGNASDSARYGVDLVAPVAPVVALAHDTGASSSDGITKDGSLVVTVVESGAHAEYSTNGGNSWSSTFNAAEGINNVQVRQVDAAGNPGSSSSISFTLDTTPPAAPDVTLANDTGSSSSDHITKDGTLNLSGFENGATVEYSIDGGKNWSASFTPTEGANNVLVHQIDVAGNTSSAGSFNFTLDTTAPAAPGVTLANDTGASSSDHITNDSRLSLSGIENGATVEYSIDGGKNWSASFTPAEGANTVLIHQIDLAGNTSSAGSFSFTLDTTAPVAPGVTLANDTGSSSSDHITNDGRFTIGALEPGATVQYSTNGGSTWSSGFTAVEGDNSVSVRQIDVAGNVSNGTDFHFTLDTKAPATPLVTLTHDTANGADNSDLLTNNSAITVSPVAEPLTREYSVDGGAWVNSYRAPTADGSHTVQARDTDLAGNSATGSLTFNLDSTPPVAPGVTLAHDTGSSSTDNVSRIGELALNGIETGATAEYSTDNGKSWSSSFSAVEGVNNIAVHQIDMAGNVSSSTNLTFTLDTTSPANPVVALTHDTANGSDNSDHITSNASLTISTPSEVVTREYSVDGGGWVSSYSPALADGYHAVTVRDTDIAGNSSTGAISFTLDTAVPAAPGVALAHDTGTNSADNISRIGNLALSGIETGATVEYSIDNGKSWSSSFSAVEGVNHLSVHQIDMAGNVSSSTNLTFTLDTTAPTYPLVSLTHDTANGPDNSDHLSNNSALTVSPAAEPVAREYSVDGSSWSNSYTAPTVDGSHTVQVLDTDLAGNSSSSSLTFTLDTMVSAPSLALAADTGTSKTDHFTSNGSLVVDGVESGATVEYSIDGGNHWGTSFSAVEGANNVSVRQIDLAGNISSSNSLSFTLDTAAAVPTVSLTHDSGSSLSDFVTNDGSLTIGSLEPDATVQYSINGGSTWTSGFTAVEGDNIVSVRQIDVAGNISNGTNFHFTLDTKAPATPLVTLTHDTANGADNSDLLTNNSAITVSPVAEPLTREYSVDGGLFVSNYTAPTADGSHAVQVRDTDLAGNSATGSITFTLDTAAAAPTVSLIHDSGSSQNDAVTNDGRLSIGSLEPGATVQYSTNGGSTWSSGFTAVEGDNSVSVRQIDVAGNVSNGTDF
ncbi:MAG: Ig-like domain-containing protein, partial [Geobacteraceae bacterium]|nr:Ig-like domain-containing protein [Geobacteraceae bacterium]